MLVPESSLADARHQILTHVEGAVAADVDPIVRKRYVELPLPTRGDDAADLLRLEGVVGQFDLDLELLRDLPGRLRKTGFRGTAVLAEGRLLDFEPGNSEWDAYAVAVDLGTTTLVASLMDANRGRDLAVVSQLNPQTRFGDDVLSRILLASRNGEGRRQLQTVVAEAVRAMIGQLCQQAGVARQQVYEVTIAGNTTMQQLLCGVDTAALGEVPFSPAAARSLALPAAELGLDIHPRGRAWIMPVIGGFVGGDTVAGVLATGLIDAEGPTLFVDIGTNGEIVLAAGGKFSAASTAAGPAFEGADLRKACAAAKGLSKKSSSTAA